jgi:hypothetical protein
MPLELACPVCGVLNTVNAGDDRKECVFCHNEIVIGEKGLE